MILPKKLPKKFRPSLIPNRIFYYNNTTMTEENDFSILGNEPELIDVSLLFPEPKDLDRARDLYKKGGYYAEGKAMTMSQLITDPYKLVRRAKAVVLVNGKSDWRVVGPFTSALKRMGFLKEQIELILNPEA
jgi:hypothetical protein